MNKKIIGVTVGTPTSPSKIEEELKPVKTVNGVEPDENGNVQVSTSQGGDASIDVTAAVGQTIVVKEVDEDGKPVKWESADYQPPIGYEPAEKALIVTMDPAPEGVGYITSHSYKEIYEHIRNGGTVVLDDIDAGILPISNVHANTAYFGKTITVNTDVGERVVVIQAAVTDKTVKHSMLAIPDANNYYSKQEMEELFGGAFAEMGEILEGFSETIPTKTSQLENDSEFVTQDNLAVKIPEIAEIAAGMVDVPEGGVGMLKQILDLTTTEEVKTINTGVMVDDYREIVLLINTFPTSTSSSTHLNFNMCNTDVRISNSLHNTQRRMHLFYAKRVSDVLWHVMLGRGIAHGAEEVLPPPLYSLGWEEVKYFGIKQAAGTELRVGAYAHADTNLVAGTRCTIFGG